MKVLVTGTSGRIGDAVAKRIAEEAEVFGLDLTPGPRTTHVGDIRNEKLLARALVGVDAVVHLAALHAPHVGIRSAREFEQVNVEATRLLIEHSLRAEVQRFVLTSTTSVYGCTTRAQDSAVWVTEELEPNPEDLYDATKLKAESLCLGAAAKGMTTIVIRMSRCFPEPEHLLAFYRLYRGVDIRDVAEGHYLSLVTPLNGFEIINLSAQSPFEEDDCNLLWRDPWMLIHRRFPTAKARFEKQGWPIPQRIDRVYVIEKAIMLLGYTPRFNFDVFLHETYA
ncbi:MAG: NAD(P)-dependent oxidoreductase [Gemmatimonadota bacterium]|nr:MAG: NAD(P)-dependent oxidoreductase [Gemmatimonadota bacterium]